MSDPSTILHDPSAALDRIEARAAEKRLPTVAEIGALRADNTDLVAALRAVLDLVDGCENVARRHADKVTRDIHRAIAADFRATLSAVQR